MRYHNLFEQLWSAEDDVLHQIKIDDTRKPKLTLKMLNRLKKIRASKKAEDAEIDYIRSVMYSTGGDDEM